MNSHANIPLEVILLEEYLQNYERQNPQATSTSLQRSFILGELAHKFRFYSVARLLGFTQQSIYRMTDRRNGDLILETVAKYAQKLRLADFSIDQIATMASRDNGHLNIIHAARYIPEIKRFDFDREKIKKLLMARDETGRLALDRIMREKNIGEHNTELDKDEKRLNVLQEAVREVVEQPKKKRAADFSELEKLANTATIADSGLMKLANTAAAHANQENVAPGTHRFMLYGGKVQRINPPTAKQPGTESLPTLIRR